jgi:hypothetical protein
MSINGFSSAKQKTAMVAASLRDASVLIGKHENSAVKLEIGGTIVPGLGLESDATDLVRRSQDIEKGIFNLLVLGEFKHGKSTLINALLGDDTLPARQTPTTAIITVLVKGDSPNVAIFEKEKENPRIVSLEDFKNEFRLTHKDIETINQSGFINRFEQINYAQLECSHRICDNGVKIIDSPGLKENKSRTEVTTRWLEQSQGVIFVLNAKQLLNEDEKKCIDQFFGEVRLNHVFFVVNYINLINSDEVNDIQEWTKQSLKEHFLKNNGQFDEEFYTRRVFFINAKGALDARTNTPLDQELLKESGVLALERELEQFLTSDEKLMAAFNTDIQMLKRIVEKSCQEIFTLKAAQNLDLENLQENQLEAEKRLKELEKQKDDVERIIHSYGETISGRIYNDLQHYSSELLNRDQDLQKFLELNEVSITNILHGIISPNHREEIKELIQGEIQKYLENKFTEWANQIPTVLQEDIENMKKSVEEQITAFQLELEQIKNIFAGVKTTDLELELEKGAIKKSLQVFMSVAMLDLSGITGTLMGRGDWMGFIRRIALQVVIGTFVLSTGAAAPIAFLVTEGIFIKFQSDGFKERLRKTIGDKLRQELPKKLSAMEQDIREKVKSQFKQVADHTTEKLHQQIEETRAEQERIIEQKRDTSFSAEQEQERLNIIGKKLIGIFARIQFEVNGKPLDRQEIDDFEILLERGISVKGVLPQAE